MTRLSVLLAFLLLSGAAIAQDSPHKARDDFFNNHGQWTILKLDDLSGCIALYEKNESKDFIVVAYNLSKDVAQIGFSTETTGLLSSKATHRFELSISPYLNDVNEFRFVKFEDEISDVSRLLVTQLSESQFNLLGRAESIQFYNTNKDLSFRSRMSLFEIDKNDTREAIKSLKVCSITIAE